LAAEVREALLTFLRERAAEAAPVMDRALLRPIDHLARDLSRGDELSPPFEAVMAEVANNTGALVPRLLAQLYPDRANSHPNANHRAVVTLLRRVDGPAFLVTTNFDECLEAAGIPEDRVEVTVDRAFAPPPNGLLKLHGTISAPGSVAATSDGLSRRRNSRPWVSSLLDAVAGRDVLSIGYGFRDWFDIVPVLEIAARDHGTRFIYCGRSQPILTRLEFSRFVRVDLGESANALVIATGTNEEQLDLPSKDEQLATTTTAIGIAEVPRVTATQALNSLSALCSRVELGEDALRLAVMAAPHLRLGIQNGADPKLAGLLLRARRYRAAERRIRRELGRTDIEPATRIYLACGAGHVAQASGRPRRAGAYYQLAEALANELGPDESWSDTLADQFLRGRAENLIGAAQRDWRPASRRLLLGAANGYWGRLAKYSETRGLPITTSLLVPLLEARLALAQGDRDRARDVLTRMEPDAIAWADPHLRVVHARLLAAADRARSRHLLRTALITSARGRRWHEVGKVLGNLAGFFGYGATGPLQMALRDLAINAYDAGKDASAYVFHPWAP
jgi:hypothetical protein